jgi:Xaa-Pro dipeptidase
VSEERSNVSSDMSRTAKLVKRLEAADLDGVALMPGPNLRYLTGLELFVSERPIVVCVLSSGRTALLLPGFESGRAANVFPEAEVFAYSDEQGYGPAFAAMAQALALNGKCLAVEYQNMRVLELRALEGAAPHAEFVSLEQGLPCLRALKDQRELQALSVAIDITEQALYRMLSWQVAGWSERQLAERLTTEMMEGGADSVAFMIVVAGPNGADPHAGPSDRPLEPGDLVTIDCGAVHAGYAADITRTFAVGKVERQLTDIYEVVRQANVAGRAAVHPGAHAEDVDRAARKVIEDAGYGPYFTHRTGHGLGIETHEPPYIVEGNRLSLEPGMVFTVEPGVYLPGLGGVRIEDDVLVTPDGAKTLTRFPREWTDLVQEE